MRSPLNRLDYYLLRQVAIAAGVIAFSLTSIVWITQSLKLVDFIVNRGIPLSTFIKLAVLTLPGMLPIIMPMTVFAAVLFVFYRLSADSELVVMHAGGISAAQIARPVIAFVLGVMAATYSLTLYFAPLSYTAFKNMQFSLRNDYSLTLLEEGVFTQITKGITVFIRERQSDGTLRGILVHDNRDANQPATILADSGVFSLKSGNPIITVNNGSRQVLQKSTRAVSMLYFDSYTLNLNQIIADETARRTPDAKEMSIQELLYPDQDLNVKTQIYYQSLGHQRLISPLSILAFAMIALAAFRQSLPRRQSAASLMAITIACVVALQGLILILYNAMGTSAAFHGVIVIANYALPITVIAYSAYFLHFAASAPQLSKQQPILPAEAS